MDGLQKWVAILKFDLHHLKDKRPKCLCRKSGWTVRILILTTRQTPGGSTNHVVIVLIKATKVGVCACSIFPHAFYMNNTSLYVNRTYIRSLHILLNYIHPHKYYTCSLKKITFLGNISCLTSWELQEFGSGFPWATWEEDSFEVGALEQVSMVKKPR